jgi:hypothetical protein
MDGFPSSAPSLTLFMGTSEHCKRADRILITAVDTPVRASTRGVPVLLVAWIVAYIVFAAIFVAYYRRWQVDYGQVADVSNVGSLRDFLMRPVDDPDLERRRRTGAIFGYALIAFGVAGLLVPAQ